MPETKRDNKGKTAADREKPGLTPDNLCRGNSDNDLSN